MALPLGQGKPLPADFPYRGDWLIEGLVFLYRSDDPSAGPRFTAICSNTEGKPCVGFLGAQVAAALGVSVDEVFAANRLGTLKLLGTEQVAPSHGGPLAKRYVFQIADGKKGALVMEAEGPSGNV